MPGLWDALQSQQPAAQPGLWGNLWAASSPPPQQQVIAPSDALSEADQRLARQRMMDMRNATNIPTINPGAGWRFDRNTMMPDDVMTDSLARHLRQENI